MTVEDAVSAQFASAFMAFAKPTFENFRRMRHSAQYFDPDSPTITPGRSGVGDLDGTVGGGRHEADQRERGPVSVRAVLRSISTSGRWVTVA